MFPLAGTDHPKSGEALANAIEGGLEAVLTFPKGARPVTVEGGGYPSIDRLALTLSGAVLKGSEPPPKPRPVGNREPGISMEQLDVVGRPILYGSSRLNVEVHAKGVRCDFDKGQSGEPLLILTGARDGNVQASITAGDLEAMLKEGATIATKQQGVAIQELEVKLTSSGPRSVIANVRVKAKKMMMSGVILVSGRLDIDEGLNAVLSRLKCTGEGMVGNIAAAMVGTKLQSVEGKKFALTALSLGDVSLRNVEISAGDPIQVSATFGAG